MSSHQTRTIASLTVLALGLMAGCAEGLGPDDLDPYAVMDAETPTKPEIIATFSSDAEPEADAGNNEICWPQARPGAIVTVMQSFGDNVDIFQGDALVLYRSWSAVEGWGEVEVAHCLNDNCTRASFANGRPGYYLVGAFGCDDYALTGIEVEFDGCHTPTIHVPLILDDLSLDCVYDIDENPPEYSP